MGEKTIDSSVEKPYESTYVGAGWTNETSTNKNKQYVWCLKVTMELNLVNLVGPGDYFSLARNATIILGEHGLQKFLKYIRCKKLKRYITWTMGTKPKWVMLCFLILCKRQLENKFISFRMRLKCGRTLRNNSLGSLLRCNPLEFCKKWDTLTMEKCRWLNMRVNSRSCTWTWNFLGNLNYIIY
jgi:hypothetical protein